MASVINSARTSGVSAFDLLTKTFNGASALVDSAARAIDSLDEKAQTLHEAVKAEEKIKRDRQEEEIIARHTREHKAFMDDIAASLTSKADIEDYKSIEARFRKALED